MEGREEGWDTKEEGNREEEERESGGTLSTVIGVVMVVRKDYLPPLELDGLLFQGRQREERIGEGREVRGKRGGGERREIYQFEIR